MKIFNKCLQLKPEGNVKLIYINFTHYINQNMPDQAAEQFGKFTCNHSEETTIINLSFIFGNICLKKGSKDLAYQ